MVGIIYSLNFCIIVSFKILENNAPRSYTTENRNRPIDDTNGICVKKKKFFCFSLCCSSTHYPTIYGLLIDFWVCHNWWTLSKAKKSVGRNKNPHKKQFVVFSRHCEILLKWIVLENVLKNLPRNNFKGLPSIPHITFTLAKFSELPKSKSSLAPPKFCWLG